MTQYLISFDDGAMMIAEVELPAADDAAHAVVRAAKEAGVWVFGGGLQSQRASIVATDGTVTEGSYPETKAVIGGLAIVDVASRRRGTGVGGQVRHLMSLRTGGPRDHVRIPLPEPSDPAPDSEPEYSQ